MYAHNQHDISISNSIPKLIISAEDSHFYIKM